MKKITNIVFQAQYYVTKPLYQKQEEEKQDEIIIKDQDTFEEILAEFDKIINPELSENYKNPGYPTQKKTEIEMSTLNKIKIIEYTTTVLYDKKTKKIWVSKRTNPDKEFYKHWQSPGGHVEESDISTKWAARREVFEETGIYLKLEELNYWRTQHYYIRN
ncbi:hypothetical protein Glove_110g92 [Diversispora epigaea]|uniref:Nudix hydrolase domain-containing protein n=1 Tax=Diversispora epigaea TaxID=1348612 RepID=A0A397J1Q5_9GLOM|nr:hypothetical protein Glove_110g92 [Diversispora epigaea]